MNFVIVMVLMLVVMYVLMIRPQRQRQAQQQSMIDAAGVGDDILTTGGIYGTITESDDDDIVVRLAEGLEVHMTRRAIAAVLPPEAQAEDDVVDGEATEEDFDEPGDDEPGDDEPGDDEPGEAGVADEEDAVRSEGTRDSTAESRL